MNPFEDNDDEPVDTLQALYGQIAEALGWTLADTLAETLPSLRQTVDTSVKGVTRQALLLAIDAHIPYDEAAGAKPKPDEPKTDEPKTDESTSTADPACRQAYYGGRERFAAGGAEPEHRDISSSYPAAMLLDNPPNDAPETPKAPGLPSAFDAAARAIKSLGGKLLVNGMARIPAHLVALVHGAVVDLSEEPPPVEPLMDPMTGKLRDPENKKTVVARIAVRTALLSKPCILDFTAQDLQPTHRMAARDKVLMALHEFGELVPRHIGRFPRGFHLSMPAPQEILEALAHEDVVGVEAVGTEHLADAMEHGYVVEIGPTDAGRLARRQFVFVRVTIRNGVLEAQSDLGIQVCRSLVIPAPMTPYEASHPSSDSKWRVRACVWAILTAAGGKHVGKVPEAHREALGPPRLNSLDRLVLNRHLYLVRLNADRALLAMSEARLAPIRKVASAVESGHDVRMRHLVLAFSEKEARELYFLHHGISLAYLETSIRDGWLHIDLATEEDRERFEVVLLSREKGVVVAEKAADVFAAITRSRS